MDFDSNDRKIPIINNDKYINMIERSGQLYGKLIAMVTNRNQLEEGRLTKPKGCVIFAHSGIIVRTLGRRSGQD